MTPQDTVNGVAVTHNHMEHDNNVADFGVTSHDLHSHDTHEQENTHVMSNGGSAVHASAVLPAKVDLSALRAAAESSDIKQSGVSFMHYIHNNNNNSNDNTNSHINPRLVSSVDMTETHPETPLFVEENTVISFSAANCDTSASELALSFLAAVDFSQYPVETRKNNKADSPRRRHSASTLSINAMPAVPSVSLSLCTLVGTYLSFLSELHLFRVSEVQLHDIFVQYLEHVLPAVYKRRNSNNNNNNNYNTNINKSSDEKSTALRNYGSIVLTSRMSMSSGELCDVVCCGCVVFVVCFVVLCCVLSY